MIKLSRQKWISLLLSFLMVASPIMGLFPFGATPALAGLNLGPEINLTPNGYKRASHINPTIYGDKVVWQDNRNGNWDIYMKNLTTGVETQITSNSTDQTNPAIYENIVVWQDVRNSNWDIYMKDLTTGTETQLTSDNTGQLNPAIHNNKVVWEDGRDGGLNLYMKDLLTGIEQKVSNGTGQTHPDIWANKIVWQEPNLGSWQPTIFMKDLISSIAGPISNGSLQYEPAIFGDLAVWRQGGSYNPAHIYISDTVSGTEAQLSNGSGQYNPDIFGNNVVWEDYRYGPPMIYLKNLTSGGENQLTANGTQQRHPAVFGNYVVWEDMRNGTPDIFTKNLTTGVVSQVNSNQSFIPADQIQGDIDGNKVVWVDNRQGAPGLYYKDVTGGGETRFKAMTTPPSATQQWNPRISGNNVVYADTMNNPFGIYLTNLTSMAESAISAGTLQFNPAISGANVVWQKYQGSWYNSQIYQRQLGGPPGTPISTSTRQYFPDISGNRIVWEQYGSPVYFANRIFTKDITTSTIEPVSSYSPSDYGTWYNYSPAVDGDNVVWVGWGNIYSKNLTTGVQQKISNGTGYWLQALEPAISGNIVVYTDASKGWGDTEIYAYDINTGQTIAVTNAPGNQRHPRISGNKIIWTDYRNGDADIYMRTISVASINKYEENTAVFEGGWIDVPHPSASGGSLKITPIDGSKADFDFYGDSVSILSVKAGGLGTFDVFIDGAFKGNVSLDDGAPNPSFKQIAASYSGLGMGAHTLEIVQVSGLVLIDAIYAEGLNSYPTHIDESSATLTNPAHWIDLVSPFVTGGNLKLNPGYAGDSATFNFTGTKVRVIGLKGPNFGIADIKIDGVYNSTIDLYRSNFAVQASLTTISGLSPGAHTIEIIVTGTMNPLSSGYMVDVDGLDVW